MNLWFAFILKKKKQFFNLKKEYIFALILAKTDIQNEIPLFALVENENENEIMKTSSSSVQSVPDDVWTYHMV